MNKSIVFILFFLFVPPVHGEALSEVVSPEIHEPSGIYNSTSVNLLNVRVTTHIETGVCIVDDYVGCTLKDVISDINRLDDYKPEIKISFNTDDYVGANTDSNATLRQRGGASRLAPLKSFRIKLDKGMPLWRDQRRLQLIKNFKDLSRIRNKLSFDFFSEIPHLPSLDTQFVNFIIEDEAEQHKLGLYTHVEHVGKEYLKRRGWDKNSSLYKAEYFYFQNDPDFELDQDGKPVRKKDFEKKLEIKTGKNHTVLIEMLKALEDDQLDFQTDIIDVYFDKNNLLTWLAVNILINNIDTKVHNYYLYNPKASKKFYLIPWDYDRAWGLAQEADGEIVNQLPNWWFTHANWWESKLFQPFLKEPNNLKLLKEAVVEIKDTYLTRVKIQEKVESYRTVVFPLIQEATDWETIALEGNDPERIAEYNRITGLLSKNVEFNYNRFLQGLKDPMPFRIEDAIVHPENHSVLFSWSKSISLFEQPILYDIEISKSKIFERESIVETIKNISATEYLLNWSHPEGRYYFRVISRDRGAPKKHWQLAFNRPIRLDNGLQAYGVKSFLVEMSDNQLENNKGGGVLWWWGVFVLLLAVRKLYNHSETN